MTNGITARDKKLLYMLGLIVIASLFYIIGIRPLNRKITKLEKQIDDAQVVHDTIKMKLYQLDMIKEFKSDAEKMAQEKSSRYYGMIESAEVDRIITNKALNYELKINNLSIQTGKEPVSVLAYVNSEAWATQQRIIEVEQMENEAVSGTNTASGSNTDALNSNTDAANKSLDDGMVDIDVIASINQDMGIYNVSDTIPADVYATSMVLDVYGNHDKAQDLLNELIKDKALRVTSYQWTDMTTVPYQYVNGELVQTEGSDGNRLVINFDLYMYDGADFKALAEQEKNAATEQNED